MAGNVGTLNREEDKEEYKVIAMNEEEDLEATISIKHGQVTLLYAFFKFCGIMDDPLELIYDDQCPDQSSNSADCALFVIKFMETISRKGEIEWKFSQVYVGVNLAYVGLKLAYVGVNRYMMV
ncbi:hypothetical protein Taro_051257 [Colocasia esculenta]|uniref:Ubiquitin-like protease family profile domain-containing protein n=1 Tax=Colocasia esculenta TaxID=4460 RepID=A0A843XFK9_COLES|nr:hypothetical protein [Colocasia esculenta]